MLSILALNIDLSAVSIHNTINLQRDKRNLCYLMPKNFV